MYSDIVREKDNVILRWQLLKKKKKETLEQQISKLKDTHWKIDIDRYGFSH